jgi:preprotein translocase subunit SecE
MKKLREAISGFRVFLADVVMEARKSSWPGREELLSSTVVVIVSVVMLSIFVGVCDKVLVEFLKLIVR